MSVIREESCTLFDEGPSEGRWAMRCQCVVGREDGKNAV